MTKKIGDKKVGGVTSTTETRSIEGTGAVSNIKGVKATQAVGGVKGAGAIGKRSATRSMSAAERQELFRLINEETEKMVSSGILPKSKREVVESAVRMVVDGGTAEDDDEK